MPSTTSTFQNWRERRQARRPDHEQLRTTADDEEDEETGITRSPRMDDGMAMDSEAHPLQLSSSSSSRNGGAAADPSSPSSTTPMISGEGTDPETGGEEGGAVPSVVGTNAATGTVRRMFTLADLEMEREMARRRTSFCVLFAAFILFRLWLQALDTGDFFLLMICLLGTSWTAQFIRHTREREEEIDRLIAGYHDNPGESGTNAEGMEVDLQRLSFQAQLAMAIIQSQREMMQGNFGDPDGYYAGGRGVSDAAKSRWERFKYQPDKQGYGSVSEIEDLGASSKAAGGGDGEESHCSICLGEYEEGENLVRLPCGHVYHEDCISAWCNNHTRCPLCNFDLESVSGETTPVTTVSTSSS